MASIARPRSLARVPISIPDHTQTMTTPVPPIYGPTNPTPVEAATAPVKYHASMIELKPGMEEKYRQLHANVWPEVVEAIRRAHIRNFNIYIVELDERRYLVSHFEYVGTNIDTDFSSMANDPTTRDKWWPLTDACQIRLPSAPPGQQWTALERVMHLD